VPCVRGRAGLSESIFALLAGAEQKQPMREVQVLAIVWSFNVIGAIAGASVALQSRWSLCPIAAGLAAITALLRWNEHVLSLRSARIFPADAAPPNACAYGASEQAQKGDPANDDDPNRVQPFVSLRKFQRKVTIGWG